MLVRRLGTAEIVIDAVLIKEIGALARMWSRELHIRHCAPMELRDVVRRLGRIAPRRRG